MSIFEDYGDFKGHVVTIYIYIYIYIYLVI